MRIPYFGENSNEVMKKINESIFSDDILRIDLYKFIQENIEKDIVFYIKDYVYVWVDDIKFNYRDKECYLPYFDFDLYEEEKGRLDDNKGHLIIKDDKRYVRYNFEYKREKIELDKEYICYSLRQQKKFKVIFTKYNTDVFSIERLYDLYIQASYKDDNYEVLKHESGYHYINKKTTSYKNLERNKRVKYDLSEYKEEPKYEEYRDVRNYRYIEIVEKIGLISNEEIYKIRTLRFESYLYCNLRENNVPIDYDVKEWKKLGVTKDYIKYYGYEIKELPLFIKSYWLNDDVIKKRIKDKTYMRVNYGKI